MTLSHVFLLPIKKISEQHTHSHSLSLSVLSQFWKKKQRILLTAGHIWIVQTQLFLCP
jgi:hypothetical protein